MVCSSPLHFTLLFALNLLEEEREDMGVGGEEVDMGEEAKRREVER
mgnify:CR=1 FL=1|jgi:hypothetical protein